MRIQQTISNAIGHATAATFLNAIVSDCFPEAVLGVTTLMFSRRAVTYLGHIYGKPIHFIPKDPVKAEKFADVITGAAYVGYGAAFYRAYNRPY